MHAPEVCWGLCIKPDDQEKKKTHTTKKNRKKTEDRGISKKTTEHENVEDKIKGYNNTCASKLAEAN